MLSNEYKFCNHLIKNEYLIDKSNLFTSVVRLTVGDEPSGDTPCLAFNLDKLKYYDTDHYISDKKDEYDFLIRSKREVLVSTANWLLELINFFNVEYELYLFYSFIDGKKMGIFKGKSLPNYKFDYLYNFYFKENGDCEILTGYERLQFENN